MKAFSLQSAQSLIRRELLAASDADTSIRSRDLAAREHEARAGEVWLTVKAELARRNIPADAWCRNQLGVTIRSMEHRAYLFKNWTIYKAAWQQAPQDGLHGLVYALALIRRELGRSVRGEKPASDRTMPVTDGADRADDELQSLGVQFYEGDALAVLGTLPDKAANCAVTSPPFFGSLRDYGNLARLGREPTIEDYLAGAVAMFRELRRVLTDDGSLWVHMGDSYAAATSTWATNNGIHTRQAVPMMRGTRATVPPGHKPKDLMMIAARLALALQQDGWYLRNEIIWRKRGVRPENVHDRFSRTHEKLYFFTKSQRYWFDQDAVREAFETKPSSASADPALPRRLLKIGDKVRMWGANPLGRNGRDVWEFATSKYRGVHPATFPEELPRRCLLASCPPNGVVIDPYAGAGTTGLAALKLGRRAILIDISHDYIVEARQRISGACLAPVSKQAIQQIPLSPTSVLYHDDCVSAMRQHVADESVDVIVADPPFFLPRDDRTVIDYYLDRNGMKPRFREKWDDFQSFDDYVGFTETWIDEAFRTLADTGSMFVWTTFHNAGAVNYVLQRQGRTILNNIMWLKRNPRPVLSTRRLQFSHDCIVWVGKTDKYHFNYEELYAASYDGDSIKKQGRQHRDIIEASVASREATGHPSAKPISVYTRLLDIAGKSDGVLLDPFAGSGTAAVVASRWGMRSILIERESSYLNIIKTRMLHEQKEGPTKRVHPLTAVTP